MNYDNYDMPHVVSDYMKFLNHKIEAEKEYLTAPSPFKEYDNVYMDPHLTTDLLGPAPQDHDTQDFQDFKVEHDYDAVANYGGGILSGILDSIGLGKKAKKGGNMFEDLNSALGGKKKKSKKQSKKDKEDEKLGEEIAHIKEVVEENKDTKKGAGIISGILDSIGLGKNIDPNINILRKEIIKNAKKHGGHQYTNGNAIIPGEENTVAESIETRVNKIIREGGTSGFSILKKAETEYKGGNDKVDVVNNTAYNVPLLKEQMPSVSGPIFGSAKRLTVEEKEKRKAEKEAKKAEREAKKAERDARKAEIEAKKEAKKAKLEAKKAEMETKKAEKEAKKAEREAKKAEREAKKEERLKKKKPAISSVLMNYKKE